MLVLVLVVGDAGAGKTRFVTEAMARAAAAGMAVVRGECLPLARTLPLFPVADALGELGRLEGGGLLAAALDAAPGYVREEVGRLLAGRTNPHIGAELYISTSTASVHVSNILRKLGVSSRVQAAAVAERAGLLAPGPP